MQVPSNKKKLILIAAILSAFTILSLITIPLVGAVNADARRDRKSSLEQFEGEILSIGESSMIVLRDGESIELSAGGRWLLITDEFANRTSWGDASRYVRAGDALIVMASVKGGNFSRNMLLGLKQGGNTLIRMRFLRRSARRHLHTRTYMGVRGEIVDKAENYFIIARNTSKIYVFVGGSWRKAGDGVTAWSEVSDEFKVGDEVRIFCHNILIMNREFAGIFGIKAIVWGYSGAIIDLTSGTAISRA